MSRQKPYVVEKVPAKYLAPHDQDKYGKIWYCHMRGYPYIPVLGSIGTWQKANTVCRLRNQFFTG